MANCLRIERGSIALRQSLLQEYSLRVYLFLSCLATLLLTDTSDVNPFTGRMTMSCSRCRGLMVREHFLDFDGTIGHMWANGYRCMNCGNVHDPVIEQHRRTRPEPVLTVSTGELDDREDEFETDPPSIMRQAA